MFYILQQNVIFIKHYSTSYQKLLGKKFSIVVTTVELGLFLISHADELNFNKWKKKQQKSDNRVEERKSPGRCFKFHKEKQGNILLRHFILFCFFLFLTYPDLFKDLANAVLLTISPRFHVNIAITVITPILFHLRIFLNLLFHFFILHCPLRSVFVINSSILYRNKFYSCNISQQTPRN